MEITYFFRKTRPVGTKSIQRVFYNVIENLPPEIQVKEEEVLYHHASLKALIANIWYVFKHQGEINHITGDIHYCAIFTKKKNTILTVNDLCFLENNRGIKKFLVWLFWLVFPVWRSELITCISNATRNQLLHSMRCNSEKVIVIDCPVSTAYKFSEKRFNKINPVILHFYPSENKNLSRSIDALKGINCTLRIIGTLTADIKAKLERSGLRYSSAVNLTDDEMVDEYLQSDILCFPSTYEGFGLPIIEAQTVGRVVLTSNYEPMSEVAGPGAELVDPYEVGAIRAGIIRLIQDSSRRKRLIAAGVENAKRFSGKRIAQEYVTVYKRLLK